MKFIIKKVSGNLHQDSKKDQDDYAAAFDSVDCLSKSFEETHVPSTSILSLEHHLFHRMDSVASPEQQCVRQRCVINAVHAFVVLQQSLDGKIKRRRAFLKITFDGHYLNLIIYFCHLLVWALFPK